MSAKSTTPKPLPPPSNKPEDTGKKDSFFTGKQIRVKKRIIVCCDGTWQDGLVMLEQWEYTNVLRLARTIDHEDTRFNPPIPQVVFYQTGVGSEKNFYSEYIQGATGASLGAKVQEAYAFIAHNYHPGDEIFLFGFSRGAYTARMVAMFIGAIGVLDRTDMDNFASIFIAYQKLGKSTVQEEILSLSKELAPWVSPGSPGKKRADSDKDSFSIKCVGVFDTVGSLGLPEELKRSKKVATLFGFPDNKLGEHIEIALHALAINETRADFNCAKFSQTPGGKAKKQVLKQCWFTGSHADIGGGWHDHDLADMSLTWMAANLSEILSLNADYLEGLPDPVAPWGTQPPHDPRTGIFALADTVERQLPTAPDSTTNEYYHPSVFQQATIPPAIKIAVEQYPELKGKLLPLEEQLHAKWPYVPGKNVPQDQQAKAHAMSGDHHASSISELAEDAVSIGSRLAHNIMGRLQQPDTMKNESGKPIQERKTFLSRLEHELASHEA